MRLLFWAGASRLSPLLALLAVLLHVKASADQPKQRHYHIAAVQIDWSYAGAGGSGPTYKKVVFREYEKGFKQAKTHPSWLGVLGPTLKGQEGEIIVVTFRNMADRPYSIHPHGIAYSKQSEGAQYFDNTARKQKEDDMVQPNCEYTYYWEVRSDVAPQGRDPACLTYIYQSHVSVVQDYNSGLIGTLLVCKPGTLNELSNQQIHFHQEFVFMFAVFDEGKSWYPPVRRSTDTHVKYTINGYTSGSLPNISMCAHTTMSLHLAGMSSEPEVFSVHVNGHVMQHYGHKVASVGLISGAATTATMTAVHSGRWLLSSKTSKHQEAGLHGFVEVKKCDGFESPRRTLTIKQKQQSKIWTYYIAAEETTWNYAPKMPAYIDENYKSRYLTQTSHRIGGNYKKAVYTQYTNDKFTERSEDKQRKAEVGILGPVIRAQIRDVIRIVFKNMASRPYSIYPHGLTIEKSQEGFNYPEGGNHTDEVPPGQTRTYEWKVLEEDEPLDEDARCLTRLYHSGVDAARDTASGLMGPLLVCKTQSLNVRNTQLKADKEQHAVFAVFDENKSWYVDDNIRSYCNWSKVNKDDPDFYTSNVMHTINGYVFDSGQQLGFCYGEITTWHVSSIGAQDYIQTATFYGHTFELNDRTEDFLSLYPMIGETISMNMDNTGVWLLASLNSHDTTRGMRVKFQDVECNHDYEYEDTVYWEPPSLDRLKIEEEKPKDIEPTKITVIDDYTDMFADELGLRSLKGHSAGSDMEQLDLSLLENGVMVAYSGGMETDRTLSSSNETRNVVNSTKIPEPESKSQNNLLLPDYGIIEDITAPNITANDLLNQSMSENQTQTQYSSESSGGSDVHNSTVDEVYEVQNTARLLVEGKDITLDNSIPVAASQLHDTSGSETDNTIVLNVTVSPCSTVASNITRPILPSPDPLEHGGSVHERIDEDTEEKLTRGDVFSYSLSLPSPTYTTEVPEVSEVPEVPEIVTDNTSGIRDNLTSNHIVPFTGHQSNDTFFYNDNGTYISNNGTHELNMSKDGRDQSQSIPIAEFTEVNISNADNLSQITTEFKLGGGSTNASDLQNGTQKYLLETMATNSSYNYTTKLKDKAQILYETPVLANVVVNASTALDNTSGIPDNLTSNHIVPFKGHQSNDKFFYNDNGTYISNNGTHELNMSKDGRDQSQSIPIAEFTEVNISNADNLSQITTEFKLGGGSTNASDLQNGTQKYLIETMATNSSYNYTTKLKDKAQILYETPVLANVVVNASTALDNTSGIRDNLTSNHIVPFTGHQSNDTFFYNDNGTYISNNGTHELNMSKDGRDQSQSIPIAEFTEVNISNADNLSQSTTEFKLGGGSTNASDLQNGTQKYLLETMATNSSYNYTTKLKDKAQILYETPVLANVVVNASTALDNTSGIRDNLTSNHIVPFKGHQSNDKFFYNDNGTYISNNGTHELNMSKDGRDQSQSIPIAEFTEVNVSNADNLSQSMTEFKLGGTTASDLQNGTQTYLLETMETNSSYNYTTKLKDNARSLYQSPVSEDFTVNTSTPDNTNGIQENLTSNAYGPFMGHQSNDTLFANDNVTDITNNGTHELSMSKVDRDQSQPIPVTEFTEVNISNADNSSQSTNLMNLGSRTNVSDLQNGNQTKFLETMSTNSSYNYNTKLKEAQILYKSPVLENVPMKTSTFHSSEELSSQGRENERVLLTQLNQTFPGEPDASVTPEHLASFSHPVPDSSSGELSISDSNEEVTIYLMNNSSEAIQTTAVNPHGHNWTYEGTYKIVIMDTPKDISKYNRQDPPKLSPQPTPTTTTKVVQRQRPQKGQGIKMKKRKLYKPLANSNPLFSPRGLNPGMSPRGSRPISYAPQPVSEEEELINRPVVIGLSRPDFSDYEIYVPGGEPDNLVLDMQEDVHGNEYEYVNYKDPYSNAENLKSFTLDEVTKYHLKNAGQNVRTYFISAEEVTWDYGGYGMRRQERSLHNQRETKFTKVVFRGYRDSSFTIPDRRGEMEEHLGILGPVIKAEVGQSIMVVFRNKGKRPFSLHPNGVSYTKSTEGLAYEDDSKYWYKYDNEVLPNNTFTYLWKVGERAGPMTDESHCRTWAYYSGVNPERDIHTGLIGPLLVCRRGTLNRTEVDSREFALLFMTFDETQSWYFEQNRQAMQTKVRQAVADRNFRENLKFHAINGIIYSLKGLRMYTDQLVRWHLINMGHPRDVSTVYFHGQTFLHKKTTGHRQAVFPLLPGGFATLEMIPSKPGLWQLETEIGTNQEKGMQTLFLVLDKECYHPLGLASGSVTDYQITAIKTRGYWKPQYARLNKQGKFNAWSTEEHNSWIQVDLLRPVMMSQVATQGARQFMQQQFVINYTISYSTDRKHWFFYKGDSTEFPKIFSGNREAYETKTNTLFPPLLGRFIRLHPLHWYNKATLRMELYGCELDGCSVPLGMESGLIEDVQITASSMASSWYGGPWKPSLARLNMQGTINAWQAKYKDMNQWLQVELPTVKKITGIITQGAKAMGSEMYVISYALQYSSDGRRWLPFTDDEDYMSKTFIGNSNNNSHAKNYIDPPIFSRFIRIIPKSWKSSITMRIELLGCDFE